MESNPVVQVVITASAYGGMSVARFNGKAVFVPFTLPGEVAKIRIIDDRKNFSIAELVEIVKPSEKRIQPPCPVYARCGGCHYQHLDYPSQLEAKESIFRDQLTRIGKQVDPNILPILPASSNTHYRNHVQFHVNELGSLCFVAMAVQEPLVEIEKCLIADEGFNSFIGELSFEEGSSLDRVSLRKGRSDLMLLLESEDLELPDISIEADVSVVHITEDDPVVISGNDHIFIDVLEKSFKVSATSFFQVNTEMAAVMVQEVLNTAVFDANSVVMDLYCGVGLFTAFLADRVKKVIAIESSPTACTDLEYNLSESDNVELYEGEAEDILPHLKEHVDLILVDPPRAGLDKKVTEAMLRLSPKTILYVSCDPTTLARDVQRFAAGGYKLVQATPIDMFPQTYHIESISIFAKG